MTSSYRVTVDNREAFAAAIIVSRYVPITGKGHFETYRPQTLRARFWRWVLGG